MTAPFRTPVRPPAPLTGLFTTVRPPPPGFGREMSAGARPWRRRTPLLIALCLSGAAHAGAVLWVLGAGGPAPDAGEPAERLAEVRIMAQAEYDALLSPAPRPGSGAPQAPPAPGADRQGAGAAAHPPAEAAFAAVTPLPDRPALGAPPQGPETPPARIPSPPPLVFPSAPAPVAGLPAEGPTAWIAPSPPRPPAPAPLPAPAAAPVPDAPPAAPAPAPRPAEGAAATASGAGQAAPETPVPPAPTAPPQAAAPAAPTVAAAPDAGLSRGDRQALQADWGARIRARIGRAQDYPEAARAAGVGGTVGLTLTVAPSGKVLSVGVADSSGSAVLDRAAVRAVLRAGRLPRAPEGLAGASFSFRIGLRFDL